MLRRWYLCWSLAVTCQLMIDNICGFDHAISEMNGSAPTHVFIEYPASFTKAVSRCRARGLRVPEPAVQERILDGLSIQINLPGFWIPVEKRLYGKWLTLSGNVFAEDISTPGTRKQGQDCAVLRTKDRLIDETECYTENVSGYICSNSDQYHCPPVCARCFTMNGTSYALYLEGISWYTAQEKCSIYGGGLAPVTRQQGLALIERIKADPTLEGHYFIGVIYGGWSWLQSKPSNKLVDILSAYNWASAEPKSGKHCAIFNLSDKLWYSELCHAKRHFLCARTMRVTKGEPSATICPTNDCNTLPNNDADQLVNMSKAVSCHCLGDTTVQRMTLAAVIFIIVLFSIAFAGIAIWYIRKKPFGADRTNIYTRKRNQSASDEEREELGSGQEKYSPKQQGKEGKPIKTYQQIDKDIIPPPKYNPESEIL